MYQKRHDFKAEYKEHYGIDWMSVDDEFKYRKKHPFSAQTRNDIIRLVTAFEKIHNASDYYIRYSKNIPVEENERHAELVKMFADNMEKLEQQFNRMINDSIYV